MKGIYLDLSTSHLTQKTVELMSNAARDEELRVGWPAMTIASYPEGLFITVPSDSEPEQWDALPEDLKIVFEFANDACISLIRFDSDGDELAGLKSYDWHADTAFKAQCLANEVIGMWREAAKHLAATHGIKLRCSSIDGKAMILTADVRFDRLTCVVVDGRITQAVVG